MFDLIQKPWRTGCARSEHETAFKMMLISSSPDMNDKLPSFPSLTELFKYGLVATSSVFVGLLFIFIGAFGELSLSNRKLLLGACLTCFGIMWHFGGRNDRCGR